MPDPSAPQGPSSHDARPPVNPQQVASPPPPPVGYAPPAYGPPPAQRSWVSRILGSVLVSVLLISLLLNFYMGGMLYRLVAGKESVYHEGDAEKRIVVLPVLGGIDSDMSSFVRSSLRDLDKKPPKALILRVESGGGGVTASDQIWHGLAQFKADHPDVPVIASFGSVAASGGYYIAAGTDTIFCEPTGFTGSIGVIAQVPTLQGTMKMLGVDWVTEVADGSPSKDTANNLYRTWNAADRAVLKNLINAAYARFTFVVTDGRPALDEGNIGEIATGDVYTADQALGNGLVDKIGYLDDAIEFAKVQAGMQPDADPQVTVIRQRGGFGLMSLLGQHNDPGRADTAALDVTELTPQRVRTFIEDLAQVRLAYRWSGH